MPQLPPEEGSPESSPPTPPRKVRLKMILTPEQAARIITVPLDQFVWSDDVPKGGEEGKNGSR